MSAYAQTAALVAATAFVGACAPLGAPEPDPDLATLCARYGCDADVPTVEDLRDDFYATPDETDAGVE
jgi:hypothetical protein